MLHRITVMPTKRNIEAAEGANLLQVLRSSGVVLHAACGGNGSCGKCMVQVNSKEHLACQTVVDRDMVVTLPEENGIILTDGIVPAQARGGQDGYLLAFDIGTTTVAGYLLHGKSGGELACDSVLNPQVSYGADVISRIRSALHGNMEALTASIRQCVGALALKLCGKAGIRTQQVTAISLVGNPAMQQLFMGILPENLAKPPFAPVLTRMYSTAAEPFFPDFPEAGLLVVPNISGYVGGDTLACILATQLYEAEELTLLVDIGTNGEMVLGNKHRMVACSAAAGPALEGAGIQFGMRGQTGAIDHVRLENGQLCCSVIGGGEAKGICGSGIIDATAAALDAGLLNQRGNLQNESRRIELTERIYLTQEDIRQVQLAKGAIAAGIQQLAAQLGICVGDIQRVYLAGAFGTCMNPSSACRIGLLPAVPETKITAAGNAAGSGAKLLVWDPEAFTLAQKVVEKVEFVELASTADFQRCFAKNMRFDSTSDYWCQKALDLGFSCAVSLKTDTLQPRQDVRDMCAADKCHAYGKNWTCPPHCGSLAQCQQKLGSYRHGILLQTVGQLEKTIDTKAYRRTEAQHLKLFHQLCELLRRRYPDALGLGSGGCRICAECAYPQPCRFPQKACASMEGYGLFISQVCKDNGCQYHHGEKTITYTACILWDS